MQIIQAEFNTMELLQWAEHITITQAFGRLVNIYGSDYVNKNLLYIKKIEVNE